MRGRHAGTGEAASREAWLGELYDRVGDGAWRLARRSAVDDVSAGELVVRAFRAFVESGHERDVELLRCVLDQVNDVRSARRIDAPPVERRGSVDMRDAFELIHVGGAHIADVASLLDCSTKELSRRLIDAVRVPQPTHAR